MRVLLTTHPAGIERVYQARLVDVVRRPHSAAIKILLPAYIEAAREFDARVRNDAWPQTIKRGISRLSLAAGPIAQKGQRAAPGVAKQVISHTKTRWRLWSSKVMGTDIFRPRGEGAWLNPMISSWTEENSRLITSISEQYLDRVAQRAQDMVRSGTSPRDFARELEKTYDITAARARLIARTEVAKLNGQITRARQVRAGVSIYTWSTSKDERVRESHRALDGKECQWDDPTVYRNPGETEWKSRSSLGAFEGHPGEDFQCRCVSYANIEETLDELLGEEAA